jgi:hypothetical protein
MVACQYENMNGITFISVPDFCIWLAWVRERPFVSDEEAAALAYVIREVRAGAAQSEEDEENV